MVWLKSALEKILVLVDGWESKMAPRESRMKLNRQARGKSSADADVVARCRKILTVLRSTKVRDRHCCLQFEHRPNPLFIPSYFELIDDPVSLTDLDGGLSDGTISNPQMFADRFVKLVDNAKSFNREGSTIYKDAERLFIVFHKSMLEEFDLEVHEDEDEEKAWSRGLRDRKQLAEKERLLYTQAQASSLAVKESSSQQDDGFLSFAKNPLIRKSVESFIHNNRKDLSREELITCITRIELGKGTAAACSASCNICRTCPEILASSTQLPLVVTPQFHEITCPANKIQKSLKRMSSNMTPRKSNDADSVEGMRKNFKQISEVKSPKSGPRPPSIKRVRHPSPDAVSHLDVN